jgi:hypothetical protein
LYFSVLAMFRWSWSIHSHTKTYTYKWVIQIHKAAYLGFFSELSSHRHPCRLLLTFL